MKWKRSLHLLFLSVFFLPFITPHHADAASFTIQPVVLTGDPAPGGGTFLLLLGPSLNDAGTVAFLASIRREGQFFRTIFTWAEGTLTPIAREGDPAPRGDVFRELTFDRVPPSLNETGAVAFAASTSPDPSIPFSFSSGIFLASGGTLSAIVRRLDPFPFDPLVDLDPDPQRRPFASFRFFSNPSINDAGNIAFAEGGRGTSFGQNSRLFLASGGTLRPIVRGPTFRVNCQQFPCRNEVLPGDPAPGGGTFRRLVVTDRPPPSINNQGAIAFLADIFIAGNQVPFRRGLFLADPDGTLTLIARSGDPAPGGGTFASNLSVFFDSVPVLNNAGAVAFRALVNRDGITSSCLFLWKNGSLTSIVQRGDPAPGGGTFLGAIQPSLNDAGDIAFFASISTPATPAGSKQGFFLASGGRITPILQVGDSIPGVGTFTGLSESPISLNNQGMLALTARIRGEGGQFIIGILLISTTTPVELVDPVPDLLDELNQTPEEAKVNLAQKAGTVDGVAADGVARVLVRATAPEPGTVELSLVDEAGMPLANPEEAGFLTQLGEATGSDNIFVPTVDVPEKGPMAFAIYRAPSRFVRAGSGDANEPDRQVSLRVRFIPQTGGATQESTTEIKIARPPVVLVHGVWSFDGAWNSFSPLITDPRFFVQPVNYRKTNAFGFDVNAPKVGKQIKDFIKDYKGARQVAAVQADVVAHSMGGLLVRRLPLLGNAFFRTNNFGLGDVHKLITIANPNFGSELARFLTKHRCVAAYFNNNDFRTDQGAIRDLVPNSQALNKINRAASPLRLHLVIGRASDQQKQATESSFGFRSLRRECRKDIPDVPPGTFFDSIHRTAEHDLIVSAPSQRGGSSGGNASAFPPLGPEVIHTRVRFFFVGLGELEAELISRRVIELLNSPAEAPLFAPFRP
ncbi:MAG: esterase/lipase family protein [Candidatus Methylomirabilales bacterium]